jgi:Lon protease-like protein
MPTQVLPLHVFEPRYRELMQQLTGPGAVPELGVVLIERGSEVGGGDRRVGTGTVARLLESECLPDGRWVARWLPEEPFPNAEVEELSEPDWDPDEQELLTAAEQEVRAAAALAAELGEVEMPAESQLSDDPAVRAWQLCAVAPLGPFDRQRLLEATPAVRLATLVTEVAAARRMLAFRLGGR